MSRKATTTVWAAVSHVLCDKTILEAILTDPICRWLLRCWYASAGTQGGSREGHPERAHCRQCKKGNREEAEVERGDRTAHEVDVGCSHVIKD